MKVLAYIALCLSGLLMFALPTYAQNCGALYAGPVECQESGCDQTVVVNQVYGDGQLVGLEPSFMWCCNEEIQDYTGWDCITFESSIRQEVMEFAMTNTLWMRDCTGHYGPFTRSSSAPERPLHLRPKLKLN